MKKKKKNYGESIEEKGGQENIFKKY